MPRMNEAAGLDHALELFDSEGEQPIGTRTTRDTAARLEDEALDVFAVQAAPPAASFTAAVSRIRTTVASVVPERRVVLAAIRLWHAKARVPVAVVASVAIVALVGTSLLTRPRESAAPATIPLPRTEGRAVAASPPAGANAPVETPARDTQPLNFAPPETATVPPAADLRSDVEITAAVPEPARVTEPRPPLSAPAVQTASGAPAPRTAASRVPDVEPRRTSAAPVNTVADERSAPPAPAVKLEDPPPIVPTIEENVVAAAPAAPPVAPARSPVPPATTAATPVARDTAEIESTLTRYRTAFGVLNASAVSAIWPTVDARALSRAFRGLAEQDVVFDRCDIRVNVTNANALCTGQVRYVTRVGSKTPRVDRREWHFTLRRAGGGWIIDGVESR